MRYFIFTTVGPTPTDYSSWTTIREDGKYPNVVKLRQAIAEKMNTDIKFICILNIQELSESDFNDWKP